MSKKKKSLSKRSNGISILDNALQRYKCLLSEQEYENLIAELENPLIPSIRANSLRSNSHDLPESLKKNYGWELEPIPFCPAGYRVHHNHNQISSTLEHRMGDYYIQEAASMLPAELFDFRSIDHPLILDMAASPGGKTTHLADRSTDKGLIIANDSSRDRIKALEIVLQKWGTINQAVTCFAGERLGDWFGELFDMVLIDAPCSMEGLRSTESHPMRAISDKERERLSQRQQNLLQSALKSARVGGQIVYSTCTLAPEENESVLMSAMKKYPGCFVIENMVQKIPISAPGLTSYGQIVYPDEMVNAIRLWPHLSHTAGFFTARLTKTASIPHEEQNYPTFQYEKIGLFPLPDSVATTLIKQIKTNYGFDLDVVQDKQNLSLWIRDERIYLVPDLLQRVFPDLLVMSIGSNLGRSIGSDFIPSHEFVARFGLEFQNGQLMLEEQYVPNWLRGEDIRNYSVSGTSKGSVVVIKDPQGRNMGRGKVLANQLKNLLPNRLF
jgi:16S rRNA (cytosine1407-C5)-methyltransferase